MPISPDDGARYAAEVSQMVSESELVIMRRVTRDLARGIDSADWVLKKQQELADLRAYLDNQVGVLIAKAGGAVWDATAMAYREGGDAAVADLEAAGLPSILPPAQMAAIQLIAQDVHARVTGAAAQILRSVPDAYQKVVSVSVGDVLFGVSTRRVATQRALDRLLGDGISGFTDSAGRNWNLPSYVEMAVRTGTGKAAIQGHVDTLVANGENEIHIIPGPRPCPICDDWAGMVLSITNELTGEATATLSEARAAGWGHPNCRCSTALYLPGYSKTDTTRTGGDDYEDSQRQRGIEQNIRHWKRQSALSLDDHRRGYADRKVREWQGAMRSHLDAHPDLKRLAYRESLTAAGYRGSVSRLRPVPPKTPIRPKVVPKSTHPYELYRHAASESVGSFTAGHWSPEAIKEGQHLIAGMARPLLRQALKNGVRINVSENVLDRIIQDGRIKSAFEAGEKGRSYLQARTSYEHDVMGLRNVHRTKHPIYGWGPNELDTGLASVYGNVEITLKKDALSHTTWTVGDSLNMNARPLWSDEISHATDEEISAMFGKGSLSTAVEEMAIRRKTPGYVPDFALFFEYIEAQVQGGVTLADIASVKVPPWLSLRSAEVLKKAGINVHI